MATCPNCGKKLHFWNIKAECSKCGVSIPNFNWIERLEEDPLEEPELSPEEEPLEPELEPEEEPLEEPEEDEPVLVISKTRIELDFE